MENKGDLKLAKILIDTKLCNKCGNCRFACPWNLFVVNENKCYPQIGNQDLCVSCGHCISICPTNAIIHEDFSLDSTHLVNQELMPDTKELYELFRARRSIRSFKEKNVEKELIKKAIDSAQFAPSTNNVKSTKYIVVQDKKIINQITNYTAEYLNKIINGFKNPILRKIYLFYSKNDLNNIKNMIRDYKEIMKNIRIGNDIILHNAPVLLFFYANKQIGYSDVNATLALQNATLALFSNGLGSFYAGYVVAAAKKNLNITKLLNIPKNHEIYGCLAIGFPRLKYDKWIERKKPDIKWY